jgi:hypothetical protein
MRKKNLYFLLSVFGLIITGNTGCDEKNCGEPVGELEYFIFGHFYGECGGEGCVETFKLEDGALFEDDLDHYPSLGTAIDAHWNKLPDEKYEAVKSLSNEIPASLFDESNHILGIPDGGDWGGIYVEAKYSGSQSSKSGSWLLDKNEYNMTQVYNDFVDKIEEKIAAIQ